MSSISPLGAMFGGCLDNAHGYELGPEQQTQLKFLALFCDHIIVPDTFFHCYGPIYNRAREFAYDKSMFSTHPAVKNDLLLRLIGEGVIRPALRDKNAIKNSSLVQNFNSIKDDHGKYLFPSTQEGNHVLQFLDEIRKVHRDKSLQQWEGSHSLSTLRALDHRVLKTDLTEIKEALTASFGNTMVNNDQWRKGYDTVIDSMRNQLGNPFFRRGPVEEAIAKTLEVPYEKVYEELAKIRVQPTTPLKKALLYLHDEMLFCYQMCQGSALKTVPSITHMLPNKSFNEETLKHAIGSSMLTGNSGALTLNLDINENALGSLTVEELMSLRDGAFKDYRIDISNILDLPTESLDEKFRFVTENYKTSIAEKIGEGNSKLFNNVVLGTLALGSVTGWAIIAKFIFQRTSQPLLKHFATNYYTRKLGPGYNNFLLSKD